MLQHMLEGDPSSVYWTADASVVSFLGAYVTAYVGGRPIQCLLDSGCERSVISRSLVPTAQLTCSRYNLTVADEANLPILGDTTLHFEVNGNRFEANVSVSPAIDDFLLGSDWLEANGAKWDFATGMLHFGDPAIHAYRRTLGKVCRQVIVSENYIVPACHEANVPVKMSDEGVPHPVDNWVIETKQLSSRVMTARTLINVNQKRLVARVCNYSDEPYELKANYCLAPAKPVGCVPGLDEKLSDSKLFMSMSSGTTRSMDLLPTAERDPTTALRATTITASATGTGAEVAVNPEMATVSVTDVTSATEMVSSTDNPTADDPYSHIQCLLDGLPDDLTAEQRARMTAFTQSRCNVFSRSEYDIGRTRIIPHCIDTGDNTPHFEQLRQHPTTQLPMMDEHVEHMLVHDVIEPATSLWCSNVVMVQKQDGLMRFCVDYRKVNELIKKDNFPLPKIDTCLDTLNGCQYYSSCDLRWGKQKSMKGTVTKLPLSPERGSGTLRC